MEWKQALALSGMLWFFPMAGLAGDLSDAPIITNLNTVPRSGPAGSPIVVRLHLFDRQEVGNIIPILYQIREGVEEIKVAIYDDGTHGDSLPNDGFYAGRMTVPLTASPGAHWFVVFVFDRDGHRSNLVLYEFVVTPSKEIT